MTKADIVDRVAAGTGLTKLETEAIIEGFFTTVIEALKEGKGIEIRGFGSYKVKKKNARNARNPKTGDKVFVEEHFAIRDRIPELPAEAARILIAASMKRGSGLHNGSDAAVTGHSEPACVGNGA